MEASVVRRPSLDRACIDENAPVGRVGADQAISRTASSVRGVPNGRLFAATTIVSLAETCVRLSSQLRAIKAAMPPISMAMTRIITLFVRMNPLPGFQRDSQAHWNLHQS